jgi:O-antigen ligase
MLTGLVVALLAVFALVIAPSEYWDEVRSISEEGTTKGTGAARIYTWTIGWEIFLDSPIIGVGQGNFPWVFGETEKEVMDDDEPFRGRSFAGRAAHSIYFTMLPELGIIGSVLIFCMIIYSIKDLHSIIKECQNKYTLKEYAFKYYNIALALEGSLVAFLVSGAFISTLYYPNLYGLLGFIVSLKYIVKLKVDNLENVQGDGYGVGR